MRYRRRRGRTWPASSSSRRIRSSRRPSPNPANRRVVSGRRGQVRPKNQKSKPFTIDRRTSEMTLIHKAKLPAMASDLKIAIGYVRAAEPQRDSQSGLTPQTEQVRAIAGANGIDLVEVIADTGQTGLTNPETPRTAKVAGRHRGGRHRHGGGFGIEPPKAQSDRKSVVEGKRVDLRGGRIIYK